MRIEWLEVPRDEVKGQWAAMYVTLNPMGEIAMSRVTYERMGEPEAFVLKVDLAGERVGLKPAGLKTPNAYPVRRHGPRGGKKIHAFRMMKEFRITLIETVQFHDADIDESGMLILNLMTAKVSPRARNHWTRRIVEVMSQKT